MRTISFINWKGGVGKTTISIHTAYALAEYWDQNRVLFIDTDKQGNASSWFHADPNKTTLTDIFRHEATAREAIQKTRYPHIDLIAADASLLDVNIEILKDPKGRQDNILKKALEPVANDYDICIIDNPPDSNIPVLNGLAMVDDLIAVVLPNKFSIQGIRQLQHEIENYNAQLGWHLNVLGVLINQCTAIWEAHIYEELSKDYRILPSIRGGKSTQRWLDHVINDEKTIFELSPHSGYARDFKRFVFKLAELIQASYTGATVL